jgi:hypothetical protein
MARGGDECDGERQHRETRIPGREAEMALQEEGQHEIEGQISREEAEGSAQASAKGSVVDERGRDQGKPASALDPALQGKESGDHKSAQQHHEPEPRAQ